MLKILLILVLLGCYQSASAQIPWFDTPYGVMIYEPANNTVALGCGTNNGGWFAVCDYNGYNYAFYIVEDYVFIPLNSHIPWGTLTIQFWYFDPMLGWNTNTTVKNF